MTEESRTNEGEIITHWTIREGIVGVDQIHPRDKEAAASEGDKDGHGMIFQKVYKRI